MIGRHCHVGIVAGLAAALVAAGMPVRLPAGDCPEWGGSPARNMVSGETGLPDSFDPSGGRNVLWSVRLGTHTYGNPTVAGGRVIVGTNDACLDGDRLRRTRGGVIHCFDQKTGERLWRLAVPRFRKPDPRFNYDDMNLGICSAATIAGDRAYVVDSRGCVLCLDVKGQADGNDGPYTDEGQFMAGEGRDPVTVEPGDGDIVWCYDMIRELPVWPQDASSSAVLLVGDLVVVGTSNGVDRSHYDVPYPDAPSLIALHRETGRLLAADAEKIGRRMLHGQWSSPAMGAVDGERLIFFGGGDGFCYAFRVPDMPPEGAVATLERVWRCDCNPRDYRFREDGTAIPYQRIYGTRKTKTRGEGPSEIIATPVFYRGRVYVAVGQDPHHGTGKGCLTCIDAAGKGDISAAGVVWRSPLVGRSLSTVSIAGGLVYVLDYAGLLHCLDAETGRRYWVHDTGGKIWSSTLVADGKIYFGTGKREFWAMQAGTQKRVSAVTRLRAKMYATPVAAGGALLVATEKYLYAVKAGENGE